ncbi:hypothetical protein [Streptomyces sp. NPDC056661]|uniref:hypothetical protein n=1 Tax=Streptomyces sp. NPDC056661 TaxID=3345898 RepID=UPI0036BE0504
MTTAITLNDLIETHLNEIAQDAWEKHRVMRRVHGDGRVLQLGAAAVWELWTCHADHGYGLCGEPLLTPAQASTLTGLWNDDLPVPDPKIPAVEIEQLDSALDGFLIDDLYHFSDVTAEIQKVNG